MSHPLHTKIHQVARQARVLVLVHAWCWFMAVIVSATLALALADYFFRYRELGLLVLSSVVWVAVCVWAARRFIGPVLSYRMEDVSVAQRVEQSYPQFGDRLSSSIQFLSDRNAASQLGSVSLQQAVVAEAEKLAEGLDLRGCLSSRATRHAVMLAVPLALLAAAVFVADSGSSRLALKRLATPWRAEAWPRWNRLYVEQAPRRLAAGQDFRVTVRDANHHLPATVVMQYWFDGDSEDQIESYRMARTKNSRSHHRTNITRPFRYRAIGGDDDTMAWISLDVVQPATVDRLHIRLHPPAHSGLPESDLSAGPIEIIEGTVIEVQGSTSRRVASADFVVEGLEQPLEAHAELADGQSLRIPARPINQRGAGQYWLRIVEPDGVIGGHETRAGWRVVADAVPEVTIRSPASDDIMTPNAVLSVRTAASDDLAIRRVVLALGDDEQALYDGPDLPPAKESLGPRDEREISFDYELSKLELKPGDVVQVSVTATDYAGQQQTTAAHSLRIVTADEFIIALQEHQQRLKRQLGEALRIQSMIQTQTKTLQTQLGEVGVVSDADIALLRGSELQQRQVQRLLADNDDGAAKLVAGLIASIESNRMDESKVAAQLADFATLLRSINQVWLPRIRSDLVRSGKAVESPSFRPADVVQLLDDASKKQGSVVASLREMIDRLSEWDDYRRFARDFSALLKSQQELGTRAGKLTTLGKRLEDLSPAERSQLIRLSIQQGALLRDLDRLVASMVQFAERPANGRAAVQLETLRAAARVAAEREVKGHMLQAGRTLGRNRLGTARREIEEAEAGLRAVVDVLSGRAEDALAGTRRLAELGEALDELATAQKDVREQFAELEKVSDPERRRAAERGLAEQQAQLAERAGELADSLHSLRADAAVAVEQGSDKARQASELAADGQTTAATEAAEDAERKFADASRQVADELRQSREQTLLRMSARFAHAVKKLAATQRSLRDRFATEQDRNSEPEAAATLDRLAAEQQSLSEATDAVSDEFQPPRAFGLALDWAARSMRDAATEMGGSGTAERIAALQDAASRRLQALLQTLEDAAPSPPAPGTGDTSPDGQGKRSPARYSAAELRIALEMQKELYERTNRLEQESRRTSRNAHRSRRERLAADQRQLSEVVGEFAAPPGSDANSSDDGTSLDDALEQAIEDVEGIDSSDFDPRLLEGLDAAADSPAGEDVGQQSTRDPLSIVAERMGHVVRRIIEDETLQPAQQLQSEILRDLLSLAEQAAQQSQQQTSRATNTPRPSQQGDDRPSRGGTANSRPAPEVDPVEAVWGTLPERVRRGIRSPLQEEFLPEYKQIIQEYYKRLAEQRSRGGR